MFCTFLFWKLIFTFINNNLSLALLIVLYRKWNLSYLNLLRFRVFFLLYANIVITCCCTYSLIPTSILAAWRWSWILVSIKSKLKHVFILYLLRLWLLRFKFYFWCFCLNFLWFIKSQLSKHLWFFFKTLILLRRDHPVS